MCLAIKWLTLSRVDRSTLSAEEKKNPDLRWSVGPTLKLLFADNTPFFFSFKLPSAQIDFGDVSYRSKHFDNLAENDEAVECKILLCVCACRE